jgi:hypothetical protein
MGRTRTEVSPDPSINQFTRLGDPPGGQAVGTTRSDDEGVLVAPFAYLT